MNKKHSISTLFFLFFCYSVYSQKTPFDIHIEPMNLNGIGGLQSYAFAQYDGKWILIGGRLDGLHRRQPFAAFDVAGNNNQILVVDPASQKKWSAPLSSLSISMQEQLSSTNMEFFQDGDHLYIVGGYGYSGTYANHITFPYLTAVSVSDVVNAVINKAPFSAYFRQITDTIFAVTGGYLNKIYDKFYLTGGHEFSGRYNPQGPTHGPGFFQAYTNSIRKFSIIDDGLNLSVIHYSPLIDAINLHRRDYNVIPQIFPNGEEGLTAFSGVFQLGIDLPFLNCVNIDSSGYTVNNNFSQYYNNYHCAHIPIYSSSSKEMHNLFFGGIAQYYDSLGTLVKDNNVPFVKTIARVTRDSNGNMAEYKLPIEMPSLLGAGSEFIKIENLPHFKNDIIKLDDITDDTTLLGYIYGGISSSASNIFFSNTGTQSIASSQIFKVFMIRNPSLGIHDLNPQSTGSLKMQVYPNSNNGIITIKFNLRYEDNIKLVIRDSNGKLLENSILENVALGENIFTKRLKNIAESGIYFISIETSYEKSTQKLIIYQ